jgi:RNA polymerase sigma-70 factor, ECF subfamily
LPQNARVEAGVATLDSDEALVARCREQRDETAFAELVRRYRHRVFRLALSILGQGFAGEAEEVTQEVMLRVHHSLASFRGEARFGSWIYRIAFNQAVNLKARVRDRAPHVSDEALAAIASHEADPHDQLLAARRSEALLECVAELPEVYQSALRLHYWMGESVAEVAALLDVPENTVKSYLHRARQLLHAMLHGRGFND